MQPYRMEANDSSSLFAEKLHLWKKTMKQKDKTVLKKWVYFFMFLLLNINFSLLESFTLKSSKYNQALIKC